MDNALRPAVPRVGEVVNLNSESVIVTRIIQNKIPHTYVVKLLVGSKDDEVECHRKGPYGFLT